jgi:hypothetical protein
MGERIEELYAISFRGPFPYNDCFWLASHLKKPSSELIPELDWYFATVAGYASSASRLAERAPEELQAAEKLLSKDFFDYFPDLEVYRPLIEAEHTPRLNERMKIVEEMRLGLLLLLREMPKPE